MKPTLNLEKINWTQFKAPVIGVDEVGRGCLAGPVYAGAVILSSTQHDSILTDSKLLSESQREKIAPLIYKHHQVSLAEASIDEIDTINILQASLLAMRRAVLGLGVTSGTILIDGNKKIPDSALDELKNFEQFTFVKGDLRVAPISAAAICAKVARDHWMMNLAKDFPQYEFQKHKGYSTALHKAAIAKFGVTEHHRKTFGGVKEHL